MAFALLLAASSGVDREASAEPIYGTTAPLTGTREEGAGITTGGEYASDGTTFTVSWNIEVEPVLVAMNGGDETLYSYTYLFSGFRRPDISHFILDLTDDCVGANGNAADPGCVTDSSVTDLEFKEFSPSDPGNSNPGMPASIIGVKFDDLPDGTLEISFLSNRAPVWGDFYLKGGNDSFAYNNGLANHLSEDVFDFIARPNGSTTSAVPEPGSLLLLGTGLLGVSYFRRKRR